MNPLKCALMNNQECRVRPKMANVNSNESLFYPYSIEINKCSGNCSNINNPCAKLCVPDVVKNMIVKVFNLMSRTNSGITLLFEHLSSRASEVKHFEIITHPQENQHAWQFFVKFNLLLFFLIS